MIILSAFRFALIFALIITTVNSNEFTTKAVNLELTRTFLNFYTKYAQSSNVEAGSELYRQMKTENFRETGKSGVVLDVPLDNLKKTVSIWETNQIISNQERENMDIILSPESDSAYFKKILEFAFVNDKKEIIFGSTAFVQLADGEKGSLFYSFRKFKLQNDPTINYVRSDSECILWGQYCATTFSIEGLDNGDSQNLVSYMRSETQKQFLDDNEQTIIYLKSEASRYERFLPNEWSEALEKVNENPDSLLDQLFDQDPFNVKNI